MLWYLLLFAVWFVVFLKIISRATLVRCKSFRCLVGKTAIITGGASGIGYQVALALASRGCRIIIADVADSTKAKEEIIRETDNINILTKQLDLSSLESVREFAGEIKKTEKKIDILINNAGVGYGSSVLMINFFGHFLLTHLLIDILKKADNAKIIWASSIMGIIGGFDLDYLRDRRMSWLYKSFYYEYCVSKFSLYITSTMLGEKLKDTGITSNSTHPGLVKTTIFSTCIEAAKSRTNLFAKLYAYFALMLSYIVGKSAEEGAQSIIHTICSKEHQHLSGRYFADCNPNHWMSKAMRRKFLNLGEKFRKEFWEKCEQIVHLEEKEKISIK